MHRRICMGLPKLHGRFHIGPPQVFHPIYPSTFPQSGNPVYHSYYVRKAPKCPIWNRMERPHMIQTRRGSPVDNRPSTSWFHHFVWKKKNTKYNLDFVWWHMTCDTWRMKCDTLHKTCDKRGRWAFPQNFSSLALTLWEWRCSEYISTKDDWLIDWLSLLLRKMFVEQPRLHQVC